MEAVTLAWIASALSAVLALAASSVSYAPSVPRWIPVALPAISSAMFLFSTAGAIALGRLSPGHRIRQSRSLRFMLAVVVLLALVLVVLVG
ncbi:hypothetical protein Pan44_21660 [Caulifigura coniformis]|uniref:Uncharacterized protein n=1 Tax=Caulifigura coniformis TaxID=2527983 RepID=A0A517SDE0_9PLAN|nr:hypothetical protein [Caulifigura coniformis]QDT54139.1 hypothetical protein Pan44_21660 [Caulifigura coniformis]